MGENWLGYDNGFCPGVWKRGKKTVTGEWRYNTQNDTFTILLDSIDSVTGNQRTVVSYDDQPEWNGWKLEKTR